MKLNDKFLIHNTDNGDILVPVEEETKNFHGVVKLNSTGSEIVHLLEKDDLSLEEVLSHFYASYPEEDKEDIKNAVTAFIDKLRGINAIL